MPEEQAIGKPSAPAVDAAKPVHRFWRNEDCLVAQVLFMVAFGCWMAARILYDNTEFADLLPAWMSLRIVRYGCFAILLGREIVFCRWDLRTIALAALLAFMAYMALMGGRTVLADGAVLIFAARNMPFRKVLIEAFVLMGCIVVVTIVASQVGIIPDQTMWSEHGTRHFLGFVWPYTPPAFVSFMVCFYVALRGKRVGILDILGAVVLSVAIYFPTLCRTVLILGPLPVVLAFVVRYLPDKFWKKRPIRLLCLGSVIVAAIVSVTLAWFFSFDSQFMQELNQLLSGRLLYGHSALVDTGVRLFGHDVNWSGTPVDNAYIHILVRCGLLFTVVGIALATNACKKALDSEDWILVVIIGCLALNGVIETTCFLLYYDVFLCLIGNAFLHRSATVASPV